jgi:hypothetical protein
MRDQYKIISLILILVFINFPDAMAQRKFYTSSGLEMTFSWADIKQNGMQTPSIIRWVPAFNLQAFFNYDATNHFGIFSGIGVRNVGFIYDQDDAIRKKYRTYNAGIPFGIKAGNFNKTFAYAGYEIEFPFNYKEKTFVNEVKSTYSVWFSDRVPVVYHSILVGVQLPKGLNLKFKYYFTKFFNADFEEIDQETGAVIKPYEELDVNVFFISLGINLFKDKTLYFFE